MESVRRLKEAGEGFAPKVAKEISCLEDVNSRRTAWRGKLVEERRSISTFWNAEILTRGSFAPSFLRIGGLRLTICYGGANFK